MGDKRPLNMLLVGNPGMDFKGVADVLGGMLRSLDVTQDAKVTELSRKDLVGSSSERTQEMCTKALRKATGGIVLLTDAPSLADKTDHYGQLALSYLAHHFEDRESQNNKDTVLLIALPRSGLAPVFTA